jgi:hypothetical protein
MKNKILKSHMIVIKIFTFFLIGILLSDTYLSDTEYNNMKLFRFSGSPYQVAYQRVKKNDDDVKKLKGISNIFFKDIGGAALKLAFYFQLTKIREKSPSMISEWQGVADAAEIPLEDVALSRIGTKIIRIFAGMEVGNDFSSNTSDKGCSIFAMTESEKGPILVNTGDVHSYPQNPKVYVIEEEYGSNQYRVIRCKGAGVNEMGLAAGGANAHYVGRDPFPDGPAADLSKEVLRYCPDVDSAVSFIRNYQISGDGYHFVLVDTSGKAAAVEKGPEGLLNIRWADSTGYVFATNVSPDSLLRAQCTSNQDYVLNSDNRYNNLQNIFSDSGFHFTFSSAEEIAFNHDSIGAICQHGDVYPGQWYTTRTRLMLPKERKILLAAKTSPDQLTWRPCECGWIEDSISTSSTSLDQKILAIPMYYILEQNFPNPFNSQTNISYELKRSTQIELTVFNQLGQLIKVLSSGFQTSGFYSVRWDGKNEVGNDVASGIYYYRLKTDDYVLVKRMTVNK